MTPPILSIDHFSCFFKTRSHEDREEKKLIDDISLRIEEGQSVALVGESGSGKTLTALSILRLVEEISPIRTVGSIAFRDEDIFLFSAEQLRQLRGNKISMIFQEPTTSLNPLYTIGDQIIEAIQLHRHVHHMQARDEAIRLLTRTGIDDAENRMNSFPHQLSGGQRQRVMIAMAISSNPQLLIADEPTTALDVTVQRQILTLLKELQRESGMSILLITHDLSLVRAFSDFAYIMQEGKIIESGPTEHLFSHPEHPYTQKLLSSFPEPMQGNIHSGINLLTCRDITCSFQRKSSFLRKKEEFVAVHKVSLAVEKGTTCGIIGESGSGKSTLALAILRLLKSTGEVIFDNEPISGYSTKKMRPLRSRMQIVFQDPFSSLSPRMRVEDIIAEGLLVHYPALTKKEREGKVIEIMEEVGLSADMRKRFPHEFSGGQRQRIAIARAVILKPQLLLLDEPTSALDMTIQQQIITLLKDLQEKYILTYLFISHDLKVIRTMAHQIVVMRHGTIVEQGPAATIFSSPQHLYTQTLFEAALNPVKTVS